MEADEQVEHKRDEEETERFGLFRLLLLGPILAVALVAALVGFLLYAGLRVFLLSTGLVDQLTRKRERRPRNIWGEATITGRTVHVFIASTFQDMQAERDILIRQVFPRLNQHYRDEGISIIPVDLRWGLRFTQTSFPLFP